ncbi:MAG: hypothetical protein HZC55_01255 [Verrucomicrobia bacterium]|nr:hypothetical protein [Verrucomicrobiota bacterium]
MTNANLETTATRVGWGIGLGVFVPVFLLLLARWHWKPGALILAFVLLVGGVAVVSELTIRRIGDKRYRAAVGLALLTVLLLVWMNVAVGGILGDDPANLMYIGVLLVGLIGTFLGRLEPRGMSRTLFVTAYAVLLVPAIAWLIGTPAFANGIAAVFGLHAVFALLFAGAAWLFRCAGSG